MSGIITQVNREEQYSPQASSNADNNGGFWGKFCSCFRTPDKHDKLTAASKKVSSGKGYLPPPKEEHIGKKCLVLDLDETLVHSSFKPVPKADYIIPVEIEGHTHSVYVLKRPGCEYFLEKCAEKFEVVVFTASLSKYADPLLDLLDKRKTITYRLFREHCLPFEGSYVKDLTAIGRPLHETIIIDNSPASYQLQPNNAIPISSWFDNMHDNELYDLLPLLDALDKVEDVTTVLEK
eukprot:GFYU01013127.1.p1 GENE.GFYU01013127.1~~GFYU01013127.1.p1  ORF type:complete len:236 (-),score=41.12 GFYU01013127.1:385-1092(-)